MRIRDAKKNGIKIQSIPLWKVELKRKDTLAEGIILHVLAMDIHSAINLALEWFSDTDDDNEIAETHAESVSYVCDSVVCQRGVFHFDESVILYWK